jgi:hypothetical protein
MTATLSVRSPPGDHPWPRVSVPLASLAGGVQAHDREVDAFQCSRLGREVAAGVDRAPDPGVNALDAPATTPDGDADVVLAALAHAIEPLITDELADALGWTLERVATAIGYAQRHPHIGGVERGDIDSGLADLLSVALVWFGIGGVGDWDVFAGWPSLWRVRLLCGSGVGGGGLEVLGPAGGDVVGWLVYWSR